MANLVGILKKLATSKVYMGTLEIFPNFSYNKNNNHKLSGH